MGLKQNIEHIKKLINQTEASCGRNPDSVLLLAASKAQSIETISKTCTLGIHHFGENYYQEAVSKITALKELPITWHFIGPIQSNKTKGIAAHFDWVHSIDRLKIAQLLNEHRPAHLAPIKVCLQVNLAGEKSKSGIAPEQALELAQAVGLLPHLQLKGLMAIPPQLKNQEEQYHLLLKLNHLLRSINQSLGLTMDTLSMGMSDDLIPAIHAGATIIRIGRAIFGERPKR